MLHSTRYALDGLLDNLAHWFGVFGPYSVHLHYPFGQDDEIVYTVGAFTYRQALRHLADSGCRGSVTKWGKLVALREGVK
jgi:hypothetical protein